RSLLCVRCAFGRKSRDHLREDQAYPGRRFALPWAIIGRAPHEPCRRRRKEAHSYLQRKNSEPPYVGACRSRVQSAKFFGEFFQACGGGFNSRAGDGGASAGRLVISRAPRL